MIQCLECTRWISGRNGQRCGGDVCKEVQQLSTCYCCGAVDDPNGTGPAINTGFCDECNEGGCRDMPAGRPCSIPRAKVRP